MSSRKISDLDPSFQPLATHFLSKANQAVAPYSCFITDGFRSYAEQDDLYAQGRTKPGKIVTNARGGDSWHNHGLAIDVAFKTPNGGLSYLDENYKKIVPIASSLKMLWGGTFPGLVDKPHFEWHPLLTLAQAKQGKRPPVWTENGTMEPDMTDDQKRALEVLERYKTSASHGNLEGAANAAVESAKNLPVLEERAKTLADVVGGITDDRDKFKGMSETLYKQQEKYAVELDCANDHPAILEEIKGLVKLEDNLPPPSNPLNDVIRALLGLFKRKKAGDDE